MKNSKLVFGLLTLMAALSMDTPAFAAHDRDVKRVARGIEKGNLDRKCGLRVDAVKRVGDGSNEWDMLIKNFAKEAEVILTECEKRRGISYCSSLTEIDLQGRKKACQMDRVVFTEKNGTIPAHATFERVAVKLRDRQKCKESKVDGEADKRDIVWTCSATAN